MAYETLPIDKNFALERLKPEQASELFAIADAERERLGRWLPWPELTLVEQDSLDFINRTIAKGETGEEYGYGIMEDGHILGHVSLMNVIAEGKKPEIGYWVRESAEGRGITTRAAQALTNLALETLELDEVIIRADPENTGSNRVAEKLGYTNTGTQYDEKHAHNFNLWVKKRA